MVKVGDIVLVPLSMLQHYGKVIATNSVYRTATGTDEPYHIVKYINSSTGKIPECRDKRCSTYCAGCGGGFWTERLQRLTKPEVALYLESAMLDPELVESEQWPKTCSKGVVAPSAPVTQTRARTKATKSSTAASSASVSRRSSGKRRND